MGEVEAARGGEPWREEEVGEERRRCKEADDEIDDIDEGAEVEGLLAVERPLDEHAFEEQHALLASAAAAADMAVRLKKGTLEIRELSLFFFAGEENKKNWPSRLCP